MAKQYGLIKPGNVFGSSDDEDDNTNKSTKVSQNVFGKQHVMQKRQIEKLHEQAVQEDSSVFLYDEVYDDIQNKRNEIKKEKKAQDSNKPKYIKKLIETAEKRKKEYERRIERQVQKERVAEGEKFKDKESFVTSAYRQKLEEIKQAELLEKREEYLETIGDVTKQPDISGFYRHIYSQKTANDESKPDEKTDKIKEPTNKKKNYRKRESSNDEDFSEKMDEKIPKTEHLFSNMDADSDFSVDSSSDEEEKESKKIQDVPAVPSEKVVEKKDDIPPVEETPELIEEVKEIKPKIDIWAKRTIGEVFLEAVKRYYERKALRESVK